MTKLISLEEVKKTIESCGQLSCIQDEYDLFLIRDKFDNLPTIDPLATIDEMMGAMIEKAEEHKENKRLDLARNTLDIVYTVRELKKRLSLTQK